MEKLLHPSLHHLFALPHRLDGIVLPLAKPLQLQQTVPQVNYTAIAYRCNLQFQDA